MMQRTLAIFLVATLGAWPAHSLVFRRAVTQPIAFNHRLHVEGNGLECVECHVYVLTQTFAGLPSLERCLECHETAVTDSAEEEKIRELAARGETLVWKRLYEVPDHVYSSHRRHVVAGGIDCAECHGPVAATTRPPARPLRALTMDFCMDCHRRRGASNDCLACHV
ncbi:MAG: cytochrome c3 family protein [Thermodesulfobacteriota bacterium]